MKLSKIVVCILLLGLCAIIVRFQYLHKTGLFSDSMPYSRIRDSIDPAPDFAAQMAGPMFDRAFLVIEAEAVSEKGNILTIKPQKLWKGDQRAIDKKLTLLPNCQNWFKLGSSYLIFLQQRAGGTYSLNFCASRVIEITPSTNLDFLSIRTPTLLMK